MLKRTIFILSCIALLFTGCDEELGEPEIALTDITPKNGYHYVSAENCGYGCLYKTDSIMWYYDYASKTSVPFCSDPACEHSYENCAAYIPGRVFGYKDKLVEVGNLRNDAAENFIDANIFTVGEFDIVSQTKREIMRKNRLTWCDTYACGNKLFIGLSEEYYLDGDYLFASSDRVRVYFMVVSLDTLEVEFMSDCLMDAVNTNITLNGIKGGRLFFEIEYSTERYEDRDTKDIESFNAERFTKYMVYDIGTSVLSEFTGKAAVSYLNGCAIYFDGKTVTFDCGDKVCELTSDHELPNVPFIPMLFENGKVYMDGTSETGECVLFIYDTETEKLNMVSHTGLDKLEFVAEKENEFIFLSYEFANSPAKITTLLKEKCVISEFTPERYKEFCRNAYEIYQSADTAE